MRTAAAAVVLQGHIELQAPDAAAARAAHAAAAGVAGRQGPGVRQQSCGGASAGAAGGAGAQAGRRGADKLRRLQARRCAQRANGVSVVGRRGASELHSSNGVWGFHTRFAGGSRRRCLCAAPKGQLEGQSSQGLDSMQDTYDPRD